MKGYSLFVWAKKVGGDPHRVYEFEFDPKILLKHKLQCGMKFQMVSDDDDTALGSLYEIKLMEMRKQNGTGVTNEQLQEFENY